MSRLIRRKKEIGAVLAVALQLTTLGLIGLILPVATQPRQSDKAPADSQMSAAPQAAAAQAQPGSDRSALRASAVYANKVYGPRASQIFNLATSRAESAESTRQTAQQSMQEGETPNEATLTTDQEDYPPYSYVYMTGTGFQPGETVDMIVVELDPTQESFEPWQVEADENGEIFTSWYIFSPDFNGATLQATATGESSQLTASATFTDASGNGTMTISPTPAQVQPGSTNNGFTFQFRALNGGGNAYGAGSFATVVIPAGWTTPTTTSGQPGFVNAIGIGTGTVTGAITVTGSGPWTITVPFNASGTSNGFNLTYGLGAGAAVTAPCATGAYTFTTSTSQNGNPVAQVNPSPLVFDGVSATLAAGAFGASAGNLNSLQSTAVTATAGQTLLILVTAEDDSSNTPRPITSVTNTGVNPPLLAPATPITTNAASSNSWVCSGNDCFFMYAFRATATGNNGTITATFTTAVKNAAIDVIALSGNNTSTPIGLTGINSGNSSSPTWNLSGTLTPGSSMLLFGDTTNFTATPPTWSTTPPSVFTLVDSFTESDGARTHNLVNYFGGPSALSVTGSLSASARWGTLAIEILPATSPPPSCLPCTAPSVTTQPSPTQTVTYGAASASFSATASGSPAPTVQWQVSTGGPFTNLANNATYSGVTSGTLTINSPTVSLSGNQYRAVFTNSCGTATSNAGTLTVNKANAVVVVTPYTCLAATYTGLPHTATVTSITGVNGETGATVGTVDVSNTTHTNAGTYPSDSWSFTGTANYNNIAATTITDCIAKANAMVVVTPYTCPTTTYTGFSHTATYTIAGVNGETGATVGTVDVTDTMHTNAGIYSGDQWTFTGTANYNDTSGTVDDCIAKADATVVVTAYTCPSTTYTGVAHTATYTINGVNGETGATVGTINVSGTSHTAAGTYNNDPWSFTGGANYNDQSGTINDCIAKANATVVVTPYTCPGTTYTGLPHTATYTVSGVNGESGATVGAVDVTGTTHTPAGTYNNDPWSFTGTANYNNTSGTVDNCIAKADATVVVTAYSVTYDSNPHTATYTISGVNGEAGATVGTVNVSGTTHTGAGTYSGDPWSFTGGANYNNQNGTVDDFIDKADATVVVTAYSVTFDANPHTATYTVTGVGTDTAAAGSSIDVSGTTHTGAGTYNGDPWSFTGGANYNNQNGTVDDFIGKANATVVVTAYSVTFDANPHTATYTVTGVGTDTAAAGSSIDVSGTTHTGAGTYNGDAWSFNGGANYNNQNGTVDDFIGKANATVVVTAYSVTFDANPHTATYTVTGVGTDTAAAGSSINVSGTTHTGAGTYNGDAWSFNGGANYNNQSGTVDDFIGKANATVVVTAYSVTFNANPHTATYTVTGVGTDTAAAGSSIDVSGTTHTGAGTYNGDAWSFNGGANYNNQNGTVDDFIGKANATVVVTAYSVTFDANPHTATYTVTGVGTDTAAAGSSINVSGTTHTGAGTYNGDAWSFNGGASYNNQSGTVDDFIGKANATVVVTAYSVTFDANPHTATYTVTGVGTDTAAAGSSIDVSGTTHTGAGTYNGDPWSFNGGANYNNQNGTVDDFIGKADATVVVTAYSVTFDANPHTATYTVTGVGTDTAAAGSSIDVSGTTHTGAGTYNGDPWSFTGGANYNNQNGTVDDFIGKANATVVVTAYSVTFDANPHTATYTVTGVGTDTAAAGSSIDVSGTTHTGAGTYNGDPWSFNGGANYNNQNGTVDDFIGKADATVVVTAYSVTFDANPHTATYTVTGVGTDTAAAGSSINVSGTTHTGAGTYNGDAWSFNGGANYNNQSGTVDDFIGKANATVVVTAYSVTFDANPHTASYTVTGVGTDTAAAGSSINVSGTTHTNAGTYNGDPWSFNGGANYNNQSGAVNDAIAKANATVVVTAYNVTYNGMPHTATYTITGVGSDTAAAGSSINVTATTHTNAGTYNGDPWSFNGGTNYNNQNGTANDAIAKANATFTVTAYNIAYDNNPHTATVGIITGVNGETGATVGTLNLSGTTHTLPSDYPSDPWTFTGTANYNNQNGTVHDIIHYGTTCTGSNPSGVILQPIDADGSSIFPRAGRTVPVKFTVCDANGNPISDPNAVFAGTGGTLTMLSAVRGQVPNPDENAYNDIPDAAFRYSSGIWIFNMATSNLQQSTTYTFRINLAYGNITFVIKIK